MAQQAAVGGGADVHVGGRIPIRRVRIPRPVFAKILAVEEIAKAFQFASG